MRKITYISVLLFFASISLSAEATYIGGRGSSSSSSKSRFYASIAAKGGLGKAGSKDTELYESRDLYNFGGELTLGLVFKGILIGATGEYIIWKQRTDASDAGNTNLSGTQVNFAPVLGLGLGKFLFQVRPILHSTISLSKESESGDSIKLFDPDSGAFGAQIVYSLGKSFVGVEYSQTTYNKIEADGSESSLSNDQKVTYSSMGLVYGYKF